MIWSLRLRVQLCRVWVQGFRDTSPNLGQSNGKDQLCLANCDVYLICPIAHSKSQALYPKPTTYNKLGLMLLAIISVC